MLIKTPVLSLFLITQDNSLAYSMSYYILIFPIYNIVLLFWGLVFNQLPFFLAFEKRMFKRIFRKPNLERGKLS